ncbi:hypothetical protein HBH79_169020 [Parastagonospora nodorum]|nr:hypothetical protein HBI01_131290 [Parastagonospora nodorum]KAH4319122.1 hypothetical protein HBI02_010900 [Parastagonospora nodorum]KAH4361476.1 hypothetical protein HBH94_182140 [Parastagonospora nodorum]KAH4461222.1 hypothetical protein HBH90_131940 [Parastagonospora nodorum]KAH4512723.1 hypothetical protein HBH88_032070 [Parastagonospora nodorum]
MRLKKNVLESSYRKIKLKPTRYASSNKGTPTLSRTTPLLVCLSIVTMLCRTIYTLNYLKLQFLSANIIALISIVLYNAIKEYYNDRIRKIIYFYSYTIENKCRTSYSNKKDIEANEREDKFTILAEEYIIDNCIIYALALTKDE